MIQKLFISNYATIDQIEIDFFSGFTTITGETGAGKSIILGALNLLLGHRFDSINFRDKNIKSIVEGFFDVSKLGLNTFFESNDIDYDNNIIIRREFLFQGKSRIFINDSPVKLDLLKQISFYLVDIHSQHENLLINDKNFQINLIDQYLGNQKTSYSDILSDYKYLFKEYNMLSMKIEEQKRLLIYQDQNSDFHDKIIKEFDILNLEIGEKEQIESEYFKISNIRVIKDSLANIISTFESSDFSLINNLNTIISQLNSIKEYDSKFKTLLLRLEKNLIDFNDILMDLHTINHDCNIDPHRLTFLEERINSINSLESRLNVMGVSNIINQITILKDELQSRFQIQNDIQKLELEKINIKERLLGISKKITILRNQGSIKLANILTKDLTALGIDHPRVHFKLFQTGELFYNGMDKIILFFSSNKGYDLKPIVDIASGGEIARLMLCVKKNLFSISSFSTIIFDEIDTGISGEVARKMGRILHAMSRQGQVICITHLPQVASLGNYHYKVLKNNYNDFTSTSIICLKDEERVKEIARMLSGDEVNQEAIANAKKMIDI